MPKNIEESQNMQPGGGRIRRPTAKVQAMRDDFEQEKTNQERDELQKARRREERIRKRDQAMKAAQVDPALKIQPSEAQRIATEVPFVADKAFESRAAGGLAHTVARASLPTPGPGKLVTRKGNIPPPPSLSKAPQLTMGHHVRISEPVEPAKLGMLTLSEVHTRKRVRAPTPFASKPEETELTGVGYNKADHGSDKEDYDTPPFTQRKRACRVILSDSDDDLLGGETVTQRIKVEAAGDGEVVQLAAESKPTSHDAGKQVTVSTKSRPKMGDYPLPDRRVIATAIEFYHALLLTENPFPEPSEELDWVKDVFDASRIYNKLPFVELDPGKIKIITARGSNLRGQFKSAAKKFVASSYGFHMADGTATKEKNRTLVTTLKNNSAFACRIGPGQELHPRPTGIYKSNVIQLVINEILFKKKEDEGIKWKEYYDPFPRVAFALTLTAIECALDEWTTGKREPVYFKEDEYKGVYKLHIKTLDYFDTQTQRQGILPRILKEAFDNGKLSAGIDDSELESAGVITISDDLIKDTIKECEEDHSGVTEEIEEEVEQSGWWLKESDDIQSDLDVELEME